MSPRLSAGLATLFAILSACGGPADRQTADEPAPDYYGTLEPFASESVYFIVTDRFVDGDPANNYETQGGSEFGTFDIPIQHPDGGQGNIGYLGGDFRGVLDNAGYIREMGFSAVWLTPIVDQPDEAFSGGKTISESAFPDRGKTGYHGYWGVNFFEVDEHLVSDDLDFADLTRALDDEYGLKFVLDIVANHGSPSFTMPVDQPKYGEIYDQNGELVADHQNLHPSELDHENPLHRFFHREPDLNELSNINDQNPDVLRYFADAYLFWIEQGVDALRIDTIKHMPHEFWQQFAEEVRAKNPGMFMFGEHWDNNAEGYAPHTWAENGAYSVLDFAGKERMRAVFGVESAPYSSIPEYLHLDDGLYRNPYELMTFYDNHDMPRMAASVDGFRDANHWLFTSRGIPVVYYGSEVAFRAGTPEHGGNRDYFGQDRIDDARSHDLRASLARIAAIRKDSPALQRGLQANLEFTEDTASFFRVYQYEGVHQTALVTLNKSDSERRVMVDKWLSPGEWRDADSGEVLTVAAEQPRLSADVAAHGARVFFLDGPNQNADLAAELERLQRGARRRQTEAEAAR